MTILNHTLGFPRVGLRRELKKAQESYWAGNSTREELLAVGRELRARHWDQQKQAGIDLLPVGGSSVRKALMRDWCAMMISLYPCASG